MIATDHAPHSAEEKAKGLEKSAFGVVGLETAFPILYTYLVHTGLLTPEALVNKLVWNPRKRFAIPMGNDFSVWDLDAQYAIDPRTSCPRARPRPLQAGTSTESAWQPSTTARPSIWQSKKNLDTALWRK